jgi:hypothetical protein
MQAHATVRLQYHQCILRHALSQPCRAERECRHRSKLGLGWVEGLWPNALKAERRQGYMANAQLYEAGAFCIRDAHVAEKRKVQSSAQL